MPILRDVIVKIDSFPEKKRRTNLVGKLSQYGKLAATAHTTLTETLTVQSHARIAFPDSNFQKLLDDAKDAATTARRLHKKLSDDIWNIEKADEQFTRISEIAKSSDRLIKNKWKDLIEKKVQDLESMVRVAKEANLSGSAQLQHFLDEVRKQSNNPPKTLEVAERVKGYLDNLIACVAELGLEGATGKFLVDAASGKGNPKDLCNPEIEAFINRHDLWRLLRVKLG